MRRYRMFIGFAYILLLIMVIDFAGDDVIAKGDSSAHFQIHIVDEQTGRGVPLVELKTNDNRLYVTDSAGWVALDDPGLMNQKVFFSLFSHGYESPKVRGSDNISGIELKVKPGEKITVKIKRTNIAERLYRVTGTGIYHDSVLLGEPVPIGEPLINAQVVGQDGGLCIKYNGKLFWFWGDTERLSYPLGNFMMTCATSDLPSKDGLNPAQGVNLNYFTTPDGFVKSMFPFGVGGNMVWAGSPMILPDETGKERLVASYMKLDTSWTILERGLAMYNDEEEVFEKIGTYDLEEKWQIPEGWGNPIKRFEDGKEWFYFNTPLNNLVRCPADINELLNQTSYEAWTCLADGSSKEPEYAELLRDAEEKLIYRWTSKAPPIGAKEELEYIKAGLMNESEAYFLPIDVESGQRIKIHNGTISWNDWRKRWILIGVQESGSSSYLGEMWYSESDNPTGPWEKACKIVTHDRYSIYNPVHHDIFDQAGGRIIYFEGCYSTSFSRSSDTATPLYDYNMIMYRLDLSDSRLKKVWD